MRQSQYIKTQTKETLKHMQKMIKNGPTENQNIRYDTAIELITKHLDIDNDLLLDIGSREGTFLNYLYALGMRKIIGIDFIKIPSKNLVVPNKFYCIMDAHKLAFTNQIFTVITMLHCLEHCHDPKMVLSEIQRVLKHNGILYLEVPGPYKKEKLSRKPILDGTIHEIPFGRNELFYLINNNFSVLFYQYYDYGNSRGHRVLCKNDKGT